MPPLPHEHDVLARDLDPQLVLARVKGSTVVDAQGRKYLDFIMGWCVGNLGWQPPALAARARRYKGPDYVYPGFSYPPWVELARLLASIAPGKLSTCFRATGGSEAVDIALQAAMVHTGRRRLLAIGGSYHGNSIGGLSVGDRSVREHCRNLLAHCSWIEPPLDEPALDRVEAQLRHGDVAAFIMEPVGINLGVRAPSAAFMHGLQQLCRRHGTLLIMDEVATGFGRTGRLFASEHFGVEPDLMCLAKAITGGLGGLGTVIATRPVARSMERHGTFYSTYGWYPRSVDIAIATVRYLSERREQLMRHVIDLGEHFRARLAGFHYPQLDDIRVRGLAIAVDLGSERQASKVVERCRRKGLLLASEGGTLLMLPALTLDVATADRGLDILERCL